MNIVKELEKQHKKTRQELTEVVAVAETQKLLGESASEDMRILRDLGMHHSIVQAEAQIERKMELENLDKKYGKVFTKDQIEELCCKYALKFLRSDNYRGVVDPVILQKMKEFSKETGVDLSATNLGYKFYIMAPQNAFNLIEATKKPVPVDPLMFYKIDENHYRLIHKWGSDFSIFRRLIGWRYSSKGAFFANTVLIAALLVGLPLSVFFDNLWFVPAAAIAGGIFQAIWFSSSDNDWHDWNHIYDSNHRVGY